MPMKGLQPHVLEALESELAYIPGGRDLEGRPLIIVNVPAELQPNTKTRLECLIEYFLHIFSDETKQRGLGLIVDARRGAWRVARSCLRLATTLMGSRAALVIVVRPDGFWDKRVDNCTKSHKDGEPTYVTLERLSSYIDFAQLPYELEGNKSYDHAEWIKTRVRVDDYCKDMSELISKMTDLQQNLETLSEIRTRQSENQLEIYWETGMDLSASAQRIINSGRSLANLLCGETAQDLIDTVQCIHELLDIVQIKQLDIENAWLRMEQCLDIAKTIGTLEEGVAEVTNWILGPADTMLNSSYQVGFDVSSSEELRRDHEKLELECRETYGRYAELLHKIDSIPSSRLPEDLKSQRDFMDFVCRSFASRLERRRNILITSQRFFRLVSEYFDKTSEVFDKLVMSNRTHDFSQASAKLLKLEESQAILEKLEKELVKEGEKLSDILSMPVKDALGRDVQVDYQEDIINVRDILDATHARKNIFNDSVKLQKVTLQQINLINTYENDAEQAAKWLNDLFDVLMEKHAEVGCNANEMQLQKDEHQSFQETAKGTYDYGCQLINGARVLRMSCRLSLEKSVNLSAKLRQVWKQIRTVGQEQLTRLRICAIFYRNVEDHCSRLNELISMVESLKTVTEAEGFTFESKTRAEIREILGNREKLLMEVGRMVRLGRLLRSRLKEPLIQQRMYENEEDGSGAGKGSNLTAIEAISARLAEVTRLAERLDAKLCEAGARTRPVPMSSSSQTTNSTIFSSSQNSSSIGSISSQTTSYATSSTNTYSTSTTAPSALMAALPVSTCVPAISTTNQTESTTAIAGPTKMATEVSADSGDSASKSSSPPPLPPPQLPLQSPEMCVGVGLSSTLDSPLPPLCFAEDETVGRESDFASQGHYEAISSDTEFPPPPEEAEMEKHAQFQETKKQMGDESNAEDSAIEGYVTATECSTTPTGRSRSDSLVLSPEIDNIPEFAFTPETHFQYNNNRFGTDEKINIGTNEKIEISDNLETNKTKLSDTKSDEVNLNGLVADKFVLYEKATDESTRKVVKEVTETTTVRISYDTRYGVASHKVISNVQEEHGQHVDYHEMQDAEYHVAMNDTVQNETNKQLETFENIPTRNILDLERYSPIMPDVKEMSLFKCEYAKREDRGIGISPLKTDRNGNLEEFFEESRKVSLEDSCDDEKNENCSCNDVSACCSQSVVSCHSKFVEVTTASLANENRYGLPLPNLT